MELKYKGIGSRLNKDDLEKLIKDEQWRGPVQCFQNEGHGDHKKSLNGTIMEKLSWKNYHGKTIIRTVGRRTRNKVAIIEDDRILMI